MRLTLLALQQLGAQLQTSLRTLETSTLAQVGAAKDAAVKAEQRVAQSRHTLEDATRSIEQASKNVRVR